MVESHSNSAEMYSHWNGGKGYHGAGRVLTKEFGVQSLVALTTERQININGDIND